MKVSVVIPAYNGKNFLQNNLPRILAIGADEIIIVDDASSDGTIEWLREKYPQVKLVIHKQNKRFPISVNDGFGAAHGDIVILLNQDVKPQYGLLKIFLNHFKDPSVFAVTFNENNRSWANAQVKRGFLEFVNGSRDDQLHESFWASGGSAAFRKEFWDKLGGFDPIFTPGYYEDLDLGWRAHRAGYKIIWDPKCKVNHTTEATFPKAFAPKTLIRIKERNYLLAHWKNLTGIELVQHIFFLQVRIIKTPGFIVPTLMALSRLPRLIWTKLV